VSDVNSYEVAAYVWLNRTLVSVSENVS